MKTYLLTWNPGKWAWDEIDGPIREIRKNGFADGQWTTNSRQLANGDRVFLLQQGAGKRGIMASGEVQGEVFEDEHYLDPAKRGYYVPVRWASILNPIRDKILDRSLLDQGVLGEMHWNTQSSGIEIPPKVANALEKLWAKHLKSAPIKVSPTADALSDEDPEEKQTVFFEGAKVSMTITQYERDPKARAACIEARGCACAVCGLNFKDRYGPMGDGFIHVHHINPISKSAGERNVDPKKDLRPVCPNCHAMLHRKVPPMSIEALRKVIQTSKA